MLGLLMLIPPTKDGDSTIRKSRRDEEEEDDIKARIAEGFDQLRFIESPDLGTCSVSSASLQCYYLLLV